MIYLFPLNGEATTSRKEQHVVEQKTVPAAAPRADAGRSTAAQMPIRSSVEEDQVDVILQGLPGTIVRKKDPRR